MSKLTRWLVVIGLALITIVLIAVTQSGCSIAIKNDGGEMDFEAIAGTIGLTMTNATHYALNEIKHQQTKIDVQQVLEALGNAGVTVFSNANPPVNEADAKTRLIDAMIVRVKSLEVEILPEDELALRESLSRLSLKKIVFKMLEIIGTKYPDMENWKNGAKDVISLIDIWLTPEVEYSNDHRILLLAFFTGIQEGCSRVSNA